MNTGDIRAEIGTILYALTKLSNRIPLLSERSVVNLLRESELIHFNQLSRLQRFKNVSRI